MDYFIKAKPFYVFLFGTSFALAQYWCATEGVNRLISLSLHGKTYIETQKKWVAGYKYYRKSQGLSEWNVFMDKGHCSAYFTVWCASVLSFIVLWDCFR
jgi:hypothetical protein